MRLVRGLSVEQAAAIERARKDRPFDSVSELARRSRVGRASLAKLAAADAFRSLGLDRRQGLWAAMREGDTLPLFEGLEDEALDAALPPERRQEAVMWDYHHVGLSLNEHPIGVLREKLSARNVLSASKLAQTANGKWVAVAGLVTVRQRPSTAKGVVFMTIEDETGVVNLLVRPGVYEQYRGVARSATGLLAEGYLRVFDGVRHVLVRRLVDLGEGLGELNPVSRDFH